VLLIRSERLFWLLQTLGWLGYLALSLLAAIGYGKPASYLYVPVVAAAAGFVLTCGLRYGYRAIWNWPLAQMAPAGVALLLLATMLYAKFYAEVLFRYCFECRPASVLGYIGYFGSAVYVMLSWSALYFGAKFARSLARERESALAANAMAHQAQLKMLRYQLNPHFLFNTLNAISTLVLDGDGATANKMVTGLSAFLRHSLDSDPMQQVTLGEELAALSRYLAIEQLRFGERLRVTIDVDERAREALVPSLMLQPLIENCVKHAIAKRIDGGVIALAARVVGADLEIVVSDDGPGLDAAPNGNGHGVGLANTRERLRVLFGERQSVVVEAAQPSGVAVRLSLPYATRAGGTAA
jgi:LytS/YehU family sensor histidine kinase